MLLCFFLFFFVVWCLGKHFVWFIETIDLGLLQWLWVSSFFLFFSLFDVWVSILFELETVVMRVLLQWLWVCSFFFLFFSLFDVWVTILVDWLKPWLLFCFNGYGFAVKPHCIFVSAHFSHSENHLQKEDGLPCTNSEASLPYLY